VLKNASGYNTLLSSRQGSRRGAHRCSTPWGRCPSSYSRTRKRSSRSLGVAAHPQPTRCRRPLPILNSGAIYPQQSTSNRQRLFAYRIRQHRSAQPSPKFRARPRTLLFRMQRMARSLLPLAIRRVSLVRPSSTGDETLFSAFTRRFSVAFLALSLSADDTHRYRLSFKSGIDMNQLPAATKM